jgi:uncharacterized Rmd1/YagE family protein
MKNLTQIGYAIIILIVFGVCFSLSQPIEAAIGYAIIATLFYMQLETIKEKIEK